MNQQFTVLFRKSYSSLLAGLALCMFLLGSTQVGAQQTGVTCNTDAGTPFIPPTFTAANLAATTSTGGIGSVYWENNSTCNFLGLPAGCGSTNIKDNVVNASTTDFARAHLDIGIGLSATLRVTESVNTYSGGNYAGFLIKSSSLLGANLLGSITIRTYNNGNATPVETSTSTSLIGINSALLSGAYEVGFWTTPGKNFDAIEITFGSLASVVVVNDVYYAVMNKYCAGPSLACNTRTPFVTAANSSTATGFPAAIDPTHTGVSGVTTLTIVNGQNIVDSDLTNFGSISAPVAGISGLSSVSVSVKDQVKPGGYAAGTFAGFDVQNTAVIGATLLGSTTINTYLGGVPKESISGGTGSLLSIPLLSASGRQTIGFISSQAFDEVQIVFSGTVGLSIGGTQIYSVVLKSFCAAPALVCSTSAVTPLTNTTYPVYINSKNTGISSLACASCGISNAENVIDGSSSSPATIALGAGAASSISFSVADALDTYPAETFAGFDLESSTLLAASLSGNTTITLYNNGSAVQTGTGSSLLVGATLLAGSRQTIGTVAQVPFDEIVITFNQLGAVNLGTISIYRAVVQKACVTAVSCNQTRYLISPDFSAVIEGTRTGFSGGVSAASSIRDPQNVISASTTDFARITNVAGASVTASISVADPADVYPPGTFAGYTISKANLPVSANLFSNLTVRTYLNGVPQENSATIGNLIDLSVFLQIFGGVPSGTLANVGFVTSKPFDEIQLVVGSFVSATNFVDVYGAFIDTRTSSNGGSLVCNFILSPDFNVTTKNVPVSGNVSTNDVVPAGTTYGTPVAGGSNPSGATITLTTAGAYSFTATSPGTYTYTVPVCSSGVTTNCPTTALTITVLDISVKTNLPVVNPDIASTIGSPTAPTPVTINVKANDGPGNPGGALGTPTIVAQSPNGVATVDGSGNVVFTPTANVYGTSVFTYQVCETPGSLSSCATATVTVTVKAPGTGATTSIADDYVKTLINTPVTGNVLTNDIGTGLSVSSPTTTVTASGTLVLASNGVYTFTPATGITGPVDFTYTACDNSATAVCGTATLHILVVTGTDLTPILYARPSSVYGSTAYSVVVDVTELNSAPTTGLITVYVTKDTKAPLSFSATATSVNNRAVQNSAWTFNNSNSSFYILTTTQSIDADGVLSFGLRGTITPGATQGVLTLSAIIDDGSGLEIKATNNSDADKINYFK